MANSALQPTCPPPVATRLKRAVGVKASTVSMCKILQRLDA